MKKVKKCDYGYLNRHKKDEIIKTIIFFLVSLLILAIGIFIYHTKNNIITIIAVLGLIPSCNELIRLIMAIKANVAACSEDLHNKIERANSNGVLNIRYDLYMTTYNKSYPVFAITCKDGAIIGITDYAQNEIKELEKHLETMLKKNNLSVGVIKIFNEEEKFINRIKELSSSDSEPNQLENSILRLMENLSV